MRLALTACALAIMTCHARGESQPPPAETTNDEFPDCENAPSAPRRYDAAPTQECATWNLDAREHEAETAKPVRPPD
jgi:hypothetical protein